MATQTKGEQSRQDEAERQLPMFQGFKLYRLEVALAGTIDLTLSAEDVQSLERALKLNGKVVVTLDVPGHPRPVQVDAVVQNRGYKLRKDADSGAKEPVTTCRIAIDADADAAY